MNLIQPLLEKQKVTEANKKNKKITKTASIIGAAAGISTAIGAVYMLQKGKIPSLKFNDLRYKEADVLIVGAGAVLGGLTGGLLADKNKNNNTLNLSEASQQFFGNMVCPVSLLTLTEHIIEKSGIKIPQINADSLGAKIANIALKFIPKAIVTVTALVLGMELGNKIMNKINNKIFKKEIKHDVKPEDYLVHADDLCLTANFLFKDAQAVSAVTSKILPWTFMVAGAKSGMPQEET